MICLERLDGRAFSLPQNIVPSVEMGRRAASNLLTAMVFIFPYLLSIRHRITADVFDTTSWEHVK